MRIVYTKHAKERMRERSILQRDIKAALSDPTSERLGIEGLYVIRKSLKNYTLEIICKKSHTTAVIITAYRL